MQLDRRVVGNRDPRQQAMNVLVLQRVEQDAIQHRTDSPPLLVVRAVNGRLDAGVVRRLVAKRSRTRIADDPAVVFRDEHAIPFRTGMLIEPSRALVRREWFQVEGDGRVDDVVVVNFRQARQVIAVCRSNLYLRHDAGLPLGKFFWHESQGTPDAKFNQAAGLPFARSANVISSIPFRSIASRTRRLGRISPSSCGSPAGGTPPISAAGWK